MEKTLRDIMYRRLEELRGVKRDRDITVWEVFTSLVEGNDSLYIVTLRGDLPILEKIAEGLSISYIAGKLGIRSAGVSEAAKLWGFKPLDVSLDFNPFYVYNDDMSPESFMAEINEILAIPITLDTARRVVYNITHLKNVKAFLEDTDE